MLKALVSQLLARGANAESHYRRGTEARERRDWKAAIRRYEYALRTNPRHADAWNDLGLVYCEEREFAKARHSFEQALAADPEHPIANLNLAHLLREEFFDFAAADLRYRHALAAAIPPGEALSGLGLSLQEQGRVEEAVDCYREAIRLDAGDLVAREYLLFALNLLSDQSAQDVFEEHLRWAAALGSVPAAPRLELKPERRIRLGFVSGDFRSHSTAAFLRPLLRELDRSRFEVFCYRSSSAADQATEAFKRIAEHWRDVYAATDAEATVKIRDDGIDILIDLSGHTRGGRPGIFARRPAPVAITWLGYLNTTGLASMDFRISDARADPPGQSEAFHTERLIRLPDVQWCFEPPSDAPAPARTGVASGAPGMTFGSCNHLAKLNDRVLALWARLLTEVPNSRLVVLAVPDDAAAQRVTAKLAVHGVSAERLEFHGRMPSDRYWQLLSGIDIALDPFPYNGGATTCECLWMGVPVVSLAGRFGFSRSGASVLGSIGLSDLVAASEDEYLVAAARLARDSARLGALRRELRERMRASPLLDAPRFARAFEHALLGTLKQSWLHA